MVEINPQADEFHGKNCRTFPLTSKNSNIYGFLGDISSNLAYDYSQGIIAYGTKRGFIRLWSMKFIELFIDNNGGGEPKEVTHLVLVSN
jgi:hypothetical protein